MSHEDQRSPLDIGAGTLRIRDVIAVAREGRPVRLAREAIPAIERGRAVVERALARNQTVYGVTTGFGALSNVIISPQDRQALQSNLLRSHACGVGDPLPIDVVRSALLLRAHSLGLGHSGVRVAVVERLIDFLNHRIHPLVPRQGSVGASGDLAPLAHLALPLIGEGKVLYQDSKQAAGEALAAVGLEPLTLEAKEALALINGTQMIASLGLLAQFDATRVTRAAEIAAAMSFEVLGGHTAALSPAVHQLRPHPGGVSVAARLRVLLEQAGKPPERTSDRIQDSYTLRCIPQVVGAVRNALAHARQSLHIEINSVTDNPICFPDTDAILSAGSFHGHPLALPCDYLTAAMASLGTFTERRIASLVDTRSSGLPAFLTPEPGTNSGYMIAQYVAASLASENKVLAHPSSVDSIPTSADVEDFNSMGMTAARHLRSVVANTTAIVAIELLCAAQAIDLRGAGTWGTGVTAGYRAVRSRIPFVGRDDVMLHDLIQQAIDLIQSGDLQALVDAAISLEPDAPHANGEGGYV